MYSREFQARAKRLLLTDMPVWEIAQELGCGQDTIYRFNRLKKVRETRPRALNGIYADGIMGELLIALAAKYPKVSDQAIACDITPSALTKYRAGMALPTMVTFHKMAKAAGLVLKLEISQ